MCFNRDLGIGVEHFELLALRDLVALGFEVALHAIGGKVFSAGAL